MSEHLRYEGTFELTQRQQLGDCNSCGLSCKRSKTHVPPKAAFNSGLASRSIVRRIGTDGSSTIGYGRKTEGGIWGYWLCESCNNKTAAWDDYYTNISKAVLAPLETRPRSFRLLPLNLHGFRPGAMVRSVLAGMVAMDPTLRSDRPKLVSAVFEGTARPWPEDLTLRLAINPDGICAAAAQNGISAMFKFRYRPVPHGLIVPPSYSAWSRVRGPNSLIAAAPFLWFLGQRTDSDELPNSMPVGNWLEDDPATVRNVDLLLPVVRLDDPDPMMFAYESMSNVWWQTCA